MQSDLESHYDVVIIGAGMSGLSAGIRLALFDKKVLILERHNAPGGLNSFYSIKGRKFDVGLHAFTNFVPPTQRKAPLCRLLRQLRMPYEAFELAPQRGSRIHFPGASMRFGNDFSLLESEVARCFPRQMDAFSRLVEYLDQVDPFDTNAAWRSTRQVLAEFISEPLLIEMLLCPIMYYGSAEEHDMDFGQFTILFRSILMEGMARPYEGIRVIMRALLNQYRQLGGKRRMKCGVQRINVSGQRAASLLLDSNEVITADHVLSSIGRVETMRLCSDQDPNCFKEKIGRLSFVETMSILDVEPKDLGWEDTIIFYSTEPKFHYHKPQKNLVELNNGVLCIPNNYCYPDKQSLPEGILRITARAHYEGWVSLDEPAYQAAKVYWFEQLKANALRILPRCDSTQAAFESHEIARDMFTPRTLVKYTGHLKGSLYGSPEKIKAGRTHLSNLYLCGTDQGFLGIVGAMLSGVIMANQHVLTPKTLVSAPS